MSRMEEYRELLQEIERPVQGLEGTLERAKERRKRRNRVLRPVVNIAAAFVIFVLLVNFCTPVAYACSKVPILRELAEAVTFSRSLTDAVENEYVQPMYLSQTDDEITASVEYLIVDQKQVNVFFRLDSERFTNLSVHPEVLAEDGSYLPCGYGLNDWDVPNGELQSITIDFIEEDVPDRLRLKLKLRDMSAFPDGTATAIVAESSDAVMFEEIEAAEPEYVACFDFLLEFDPKFTAVGKVIPIQQTVVLEGQEITITEMQIYPTHLRVNIEGAADNTAWLKMLYFYIETDWGMKFEAVSNGITATGDTDSLNMVSFRADSSYFYEAKHLEIVITGAEWLNKDMEKVYVNLETGETGPLPEGVELYAASKRSADSWVEFHADYREEDHFHQLFSSEYYDTEGKQHYIYSYSVIHGEINEEGGYDYFIESFPLKGYFQEEVWLCPAYSHVWTADEPVRVLVQ